MSGLLLGLGLIGIGRPWPTDSDTLPSEETVAELLREAVNQGIVFFDTAPAYGESEARLGKQLRGALRDVRDRLTVATKVGEDWSQSSGAVIDHSPAALHRSVERSIERLGQIHVLQVHKATVEVINDRAVQSALTSIRDTYGIAHLGISAKDEETCAAAVRSGLFSHVQIPLNLAHPGLADWAVRHQHAVRLLINRPFASGKLHDRRTDAARYLIDLISEGIVLTGTKNPSHLKQTATVWRDVAAKERDE